MSTNLPLAYHITFGTYGRRLHGDGRGTVDRSMNKPGDPIIGSVPQRWECENTLLRFNPVDLTPAQRQSAEFALPVICNRGSWTCHIGAVKPDHVHILLAADRDGQAIRKCSNAGSASIYRSTGRCIRTRLGSPNVEV